MVSRVENPNVYTDLSGLQAISRTGRDNTPEGLRQVARQFESLFINMMLKAMRNSNSSLFEDNFLRSNEMEFHQENLDNQLSLNMSDAGGIGLADALYRQMLGRFNVSETEKSVTVAQRQIAPRRPVVPVAESLPVSDTASMTYDAIHSPEDFVIRLLPFAEAAASRIGVDPRLLLAQSALETGWGSAVPAGSDGNSSHNLFGVKADSRWAGDQVNVNTLEYRGGIVKQERASFRSYASFAESFADYVEFLQTNPRYSQALQHAANPEVFAEQLQAAGYATDPAYAEKVKDVMNGPLLQSSLQKAHLQQASSGQTQWQQVN